ncbi:SURF1 family cytochrome oxidase biogenesis protein [Microcella humidisoli]|uniref:SURF1-like protein n=1 Tax=Microcella humidisoli TaxID=2963406 RepID=A0ABY5FX14_9MICO|nr:SURF1 family protein [Microcella humidisoli]UTT62301.1 SURF1 family protein [Microcella humidisoli]
MSILSLALTRRWLGWLAFTTVFAIVCVGLAQWQWARRLEAVAEIRVVAQNWDAAPVALRQALPAGEQLDPAAEWTPVVVEGEYLVDEQLLARNRPFGGRPGFAVLTPLLLETGEVLVVDRGWVPTGDAQDQPDAVPAPPAGTVEVLVRLKPGEPTIAGRGAPEGQVATINLPQIAELVDGGRVITGAYGLMDRESPTTAERPAAVLRPVADEGPHLSYTFQWYLFALLGFVGYGWALRQEHRGLRAADADTPPPPPRRPRRSGPSDDEVEDAIVERQAAGRQASEISSA